MKRKLMARLKRKSKDGQDKNSGIAFIFMDNFEMKI